MLRVRRLGSVPYEEALALQHALIERSDDNYLLLLEHPHVYTLGVRTDPSHFLVDPATVGARAVLTDRGGDVTYHGPGQSVIYPLVTVRDDPGAGRVHVTVLEQLLIDVLVDLGVRTVGRFDGFPGVWLHDGAVPRKIAAIGVKATKVRDGRRRTLHGIACNVTTDLSMFSHIVPCGIADYPVTSLAASGYDVGMEEFEDAVVRRGIERWGEHGADEQKATPARGSKDRREQSDGPSSLRRLRQAGVRVEGAVSLSQRKPDWLRAKLSMGEVFHETKSTIEDLGLVTVCEEAGCPNIYECWADRTATFMVNGDRCTRACGFCLVDTSRPLPLDPTEPERVSEAVERLGLDHVVITCVARDDLLDGGAGAISACVTAIRARRAQTSVEVLISDFKGDEDALARIIEVRPEIVNHNIETVLRLQRAVRPSASYARSLAVLARVTSAGLVAKSGLMVGLGEESSEVASTLADLAAVGVQIATIGQYLRPSAAHLPVSRFYAPEEFDALADLGRTHGLAHVESSPLTRSSYHAKDAFTSTKTPVALSARC